MGFLNDTKYKAHGKGHRIHPYNEVLPSNEKSQNYKTTKLPNAENRIVVYRGRECGGCSRPRGSKGTNFQV